MRFSALICRYAFSAYALTMGFKIQFIIWGTTQNFQCIISGNSMDDKGPVVIVASDMMTQTRWT